MYRDLRLYDRDNPSIYSSLYYNNGIVIELNSPTDTIWLNGNIQTTGKASIGSNFTVGGISTFQDDIYMYQDLRLYDKNNPSIYSSLYYDCREFVIELNSPTDVILSNGNMIIYGSRI